MSSVYIITSESYSDAALERLERHLHAAGHSVFSIKTCLANYKKRFNGELRESEKTQLRIKQLLACDKVATLGNWIEDSICNLEMHIATATGKPIIRILKG